MANVPSGGLMAIGDEGGVTTGALSRSHSLQVQSLSWGGSNGSRPSACLDMAASIALDILPLGHLAHKNLAE